jgi:hypothetical protein
MLGGIGSNRDRIGRIQLRQLNFGPRLRDGADKQQR